MNNKKSYLYLVILVMALMTMPQLGFASVESSLMGIQTKLTREIGRAHV